MTRLERFLQYAHDHASEVVDAQEDNVNKLIRQLEREQREAERAARGGLSRRPAAAELGDVPF
jgi:hypothetical protein